MADKKAIVTLSKDFKALTFYYDNKKHSDCYSWEIGDGSYHSWYKPYRWEYVKFDKSFVDYDGLTSCAEWFNGCYVLRNIYGEDYLNTSNVSTMKKMFSGCHLLENVYLSNLNVSKVKNMSEMFSNCPSLLNIDMRDWDTSNVKNMSEMFYGCKSLKTVIGLNKFNTVNVKNFSSMFEDCFNLEELDLSNWNTSKVENMSFVFANCKLLNSLDVSSWDTAKVKNMQSMFFECISLKSIDLSGWDFSNVKDISFMFDGYTGRHALNNLGDICDWKFDKLENHSCVFGINNNLYEKYGSTLYRKLEAVGNRAENTKSNLESSVRDADRGSENHSLTKQMER